MEITNQQANFLNPKSPTLAATYDATINSDTTVTLNAKTAVVIVSAESKGIFMKWDGTASSSSFDEYISPGYTNVYVRPEGVTTAHFVEQAASAVLIVIEK